MRPSPSFAHAPHKHLQRQLKPRWVAGSFAHLLQTSSEEPPVGQATELAAVSARRLSLCTDLASGALNSSPAFKVARTLGSFNARLAAFSRNYAGPMDPDSWHVMLVCTSSASARFRKAAW